MAGFESGLKAAPPPHDEQAARRRARIGFLLFTIYAVAYGAFVVVNAFRPDWMDHVPFGGLNVAIVTGLGLIGVALILALLYGRLCRTPEASS